MTLTLPSLNVCALTSEPERTAVSVSVVVVLNPVKEDPDIIPVAVMLDGANESTCSVDADSIA